MPKSVSWYRVDGACDNGDHFGGESVEYKLKRSSTKECYKQCRHVKFKGTIAKWPVHKQTHRTTQNT